MTKKDQQHRPQFTKHRKNKGQFKRKNSFNKELSKKLNERFSDIKTKNKGDDILEISFGRD
tara:strand:+ start:9413 stop:9595 length:183 start_codon:yes stop_codon:yes gene_type:complete